MTCSALVLFGLALSACFEDVPVVEVEGAAGNAITPPLEMEATDTVASFRWEVVESVEDSFVAGTEATTPSATFRFDRRGPYLIDRWIVSGLSERLTHHVVVTVRGVAPRADILGSHFVGVGEPGVFDATTSSSLEERPLSYRWQLATRPALSQASLPADEIDKVVLSFVPDVAGFYDIQLRVFDGELWSEPAAIRLEVHE